VLVIRRLWTRITSGRRARWPYPLLAQGGQALPLALVALAVGTLLVSPFLADVSANLLAGRRTDENIAGYYSADAGIEWGLWRLKNKPLLTTEETYTPTPLEPTPTSINGDSFPTTEIRFVSGADASETITPDWQTGDGPKCYAVTSTESGPIFVVVNTADTSDVWVTLLSGLDSSCVMPVGLEPLSGISPYTVEFADQPAGSYQVLVETAPSGTGTLMINYAVASYDLQSERDGRAITVRATASPNAVKVISWQLD
jgi:hypothetical protein